MTKKGQKKRKNLQNNLSCGKSELKYLNTVPPQVESMAKEILPSYGYSLPAMELQITLCGENSI